jgi:hypothetical protein
MQIYPQHNVAENPIFQEIRLKHRKGSHMNPGDKVENFTLQNQDGNAPGPEFRIGSHEDPSTTFGFVYCRNNRGCLSG